MGVEERKTNITHLLFVDDLKLYATGLNQLKLLLDLVTCFSNDIGMKFGESKCAYMSIDRGKLTNNDQPIVINNVTIKPLSNGESYRYLGQDENLSHDGPVNEERVTKEYYRRVRKIWSSHLSAYNKTVAHNAFAVPIIIPTVGIINWSINDINQN